MTQTLRALSRSTRTAVSFGMREYFAPLTVGFRALFAAMDAVFHLPAKAHRAARSMSSATFLERDWAAVAVALVLGAHYLEFWALGIKHITADWTCFIAVGAYLVAALLRSSAGSVKEH
jgi:hypothetical protein